MAKFKWNRWFPGGMVPFVDPDGARGFEKVKTESHYGEGEAGSFARVKARGARKQGTKSVKVTKSRGGGRIRSWRRTAKNGVVVVTHRKRRGRRKK